MKFVQFALPIFLSLTIWSEARFSEHVILTPVEKRPALQMFQPTLLASRANPQVVMVRIPYIEDGKDYWLVLAEKPLADKNLNFRSTIGNKLLPDGVQVVSPIARVGRWEGGSFIQKPKFLEVALRRKDLPRVYIYHDFANNLVLDGGYYLTIKVSAYPVQNPHVFELKEP